MKKSLIIATIPLFFGLTACAAEPAKPGPANPMAPTACTPAPCVQFNGAELGELAKLIGDRMQQVQAEGNALNEIIMDVRKQTQEPSQTPQPASKK